MKTLVAVLSLCALAYTEYCPKMLSEIRQEDINDVETGEMLSIHLYSGGHIFSTPTILADRIFLHFSALL
ncbi:hypothetical protein Y032_0009g594 [Ancylostoma ceylanicum]|uniref:Uncharacterized protein n=1 Tax=Ancylostoma ceylanicum TaxID=53326 RepID=A0A016VIH3_9BILA|nr:hypothetical protein Y032_0009g594 [Ancylostoma ceylanicum]